MYVFTGEKSYLRTDWEPGRKYTLAKFTDGDGKQWWQLAYRWGFWTCYLNDLQEFDSGSICPVGPMEFDSAEQAMRHLDRERKWHDAQSRSQKVSVEFVGD